MRYFKKYDIIHSSKREENKKMKIDADVMFVRPLKDFSMNDSIPVDLDYVEDFEEVKEYVANEIFARYGRFCVYDSDFTICNDSEIMEALENVA